MLSLGKTSRLHYEVTHWDFGCGYACIFQAIPSLSAFEILEPICVQHQQIGGSRGVSSFAIALCQKHQEIGPGGQCTCLECLAYFERPAYSSGNTIPALLSARNQCLWMPLLPSYSLRKVSYMTQSHSPGYKEIGQRWPRYYSFHKPKSTFMKSQVTCQSQLDETLGHWTCIQGKTVCH